jgi:protein involved in polysaccharide export with SLBB domain
MQRQFQDLNSKRSEVDEQKMQEMYKNDPDYLEYLNATRQEQEQKIDTLNKSDSLRKSVYGANFFSNNVFDLSDKAPTAPPLDYRLGPGDEIIVSLWGGAELQQNYTIAKDGSIFPRLVGKIYLQGLTFDAASRAIKQQFKKIVPTSTNIDVQMGKPRTIRVTIVGEVKKQGTYTISAFNSALNALFRAGGLTDYGNLRKIEIRRAGQTVDILDLYEYLKTNSIKDIIIKNNKYQIKPLEQLMMVIPPEFANILPVECRNIFKCKELKKYFPDDFDFDIFMKTKFWMCYPEIPNPNYNDFIKVIHKIKLTEESEKLNKNFKVLEISK